MSKKQKEVIDCIDVSSKACCIRLAYKGMSWMDSLEFVGLLDEIQDKLLGACYRLQRGEKAFHLKTMSHFRGVLFDVASIFYWSVTPVGKKTIPKKYIADEFYGRKDLADLLFDFLLKEIEKDPSQDFNKKAVRRLLQRFFDKNFAKCVRFPLPKVGVVYVKTGKSYKNINSALQSDSIKEDLMCFVKNSSSVTEVINQYCFFVEKNFRNQLDQYWSIKSLEWKK